MTASDPFGSRHGCAPTGDCVGFGVDRSEAPRPGPGHVVVAVEAVALADEERWEKGATVRTAVPRRVGWSGRVEETGPGVDTGLRGRKTVVRTLPAPRPSTSSGGYGQRSAAGRYVLRRHLVVPLDRLHLLPSDADLATAALLEPAAVAAAAFEAAAVQTRPRVAVLGADCVGLLLVQMMTAMSPLALVVVDPSPDRGGRALAWGATRHCTTVEAARTEGVFDVVVDTTGSAGSPGAACLLAARAGQVVFTRAFPPGTKPLDQAQLALRRLTVRAAAVDAPAVWDTAVRLFREGVIDPRPLVSRWLEPTVLADGFIGPRSEGGTVTVLRIP
ncbi:zinc-binding dehydrogenase [Streptomyces sp. NPDC057376]|uniref:zinc-binding dehydrogenase n=1 Tax=unclassified Streptomyces TaxID=2593676 RepID=UPI00093DAAF6|nr:zinc-binding dehydrogenase [Streptomyces sp. CB02414]